MDDLSPELYRELATIIQAEYLPQWLATSDPALGQRTPAQVLADEGEDRIWRAIERLRSGDLA